MSASNVKPPIKPELRQDGTRNPLGQDRNASPQTPRRRTTEADWQEFFGANGLIDLDIIASEQLRIVEVRAAFL